MLKSRVCLKSVNFLLKNTLIVKYFVYYSQNIKCHNAPFYKILQKTLTYEKLNSLI